jgi:hypothetical protein
VIAIVKWNFLSKPEMLPLLFFPEDREIVYHFGGSSVPFLPNPSRGEEESNSFYS